MKNLTETEYFDIYFDPNLVIVEKQTQMSDMHITTLSDGKGNILACREITSQGVEYYVPEE